jgi:methylated-DNA-protein-cysteine methyltransferase-like protein
MEDMEPKPLYSRFYEIIQRIPKGRVATYGQIANIAGFPGYARQVGYALNSLPEGIDVPWHRVINSKGMISIKKGGFYDNIQRLLLEEEGVNFDNRNRVSLTKHKWEPKRE